MAHWYPDDAAIERVARGMMDHTLAKDAWTHAAHFAACLWLLDQPAEIPLEARMPDLIHAYNVAVGGVNSDTAGYHETITLASIRAARRHRAQAPGPLHESLDALMDGALGRSDWLLAYWRRETLFSVAARRTWVDPDLSPLA
ncbi:hypothetical protein [Phenylobacterium immobile]|uniref:hypothetical protein n=1 Tax=Phenylobacterium immobile TaxID=21 RepID=UPI000A7C1181|nr:hypothetical protein [Phenylobacterium immobile]